MKYQVPKQVKGSHEHASGGSKIQKKSGVPMDVPPAGQISLKVKGYEGRAMKVVITTGYGYGYIQFVMTLRIQSEEGGIFDAQVSSQKEGGYLRPRCKTVGRHELHRY